MNRQHDGIVRIGNLTAPARWTEGPVMTIRFQTGPLNLDQRQLIDHLRQCSDPVFVALNDKPALEPKHIIGYQCDACSVTFHVAKDWKPSAMPKTDTAQ